MGYIPSCGTISQADSSMTKRKARTYYSFRSFLSYLGQFKWRLAIVATTFLASCTFLAVMPWFIGKLVGSLAQQHIDTHQAYVYAWILIGCSTAHDVLWRGSELLYRYLLNGIGFQYETIVFSHAIHKPYPYFVDKFTGKIASYTNLLGQEFRDFMEHIFWTYSGHIVNLVAITVILTAINWQTGLVFLIGLVLLIIAGRITMGNSMKYEKAWADTRSTKNGFIFDAIANFVNVKSFQKEAREATTIQQQQDKTIKAGNRAFMWNVVFWGSMSQVVRNFIWPVSILLNVYLYLHGRISLAALTTFLTAVVLFTNYVWEIIWSISQFSLQLARIEEAHSYLFGDVNIIKQPVTTKREITPPEFTKTILFNNITFAYPDKKDTTVLHDIHLQIKKGDKVGIVGKSGSGKTTLTKLLLDYYQVGTDQILLDGQQVSTHELSSLVSYVPQDTALFHRTVAENIAYATAEEVDQAAVIAAAKRANAHEFIVAIDHGYDALVGERGVKLSAGQRQRIAIARAFLDNKPILILDEATSALDSESEVLVQDALEKLWKEKTVIAIAHRLSTLRHMDRILVMDKGRIAEQGTHQELISKNGLYAKLWNHQSGGFLED